jgi:hypothetical protein
MPSIARRARFRGRPPPQRRMRSPECRIRSPLYSLLAGLASRKVFFIEKCVARLIFLWELLVRETEVASSSFMVRVRSSMSNPERKILGYANLSKRAMFPLFQYFLTATIKDEF